jgi:aspartate aminotransferase/aminotransferase
MIKKAGLTALRGSATFYFFISIGNFPGSSKDFALKLLTEQHVAVVPGSAYGDSTDRFVRVSIGTEPEERIWQALQRIKRMTEVNHFDPADLSRKIADLKERIVDSSSSAFVGSSALS